MTALLAGCNPLAATDLSEGTGGGAETRAFEARCNANGVIRCFGFDDATELLHYYAAPSPGDVRASVDTVIKTSGAGAMRLRVPAQTEAEMTGEFSMNFTPGSANLENTMGGAEYPDQFGEGETFYVQWRERFGPELLDPAYQGGNGWLQAVVGLGDRSDSQGYAFSSLEVAIANAYYGGLPEAVAYNDPVIVDVPGSTDYWIQNAADCRKSNDGKPPCRAYRAEDWMTFQFGVTVGHWNEPDSRLQVWLGYEHEPSAKIIDVPDLMLSNVEGDGSIVDPTAKYGKVWFMLYDGSKEPTMSNPETSVWIDELVVSSQPIGDP